MSDPDPGLGFDQADFWKTQDGELLFIREMATTHRIHTARMLIRRAWGRPEDKRQERIDRIRTSPLFASLTFGLTEADLGPGVLDGDLPE